MAKKTVRISDKSGTTIEDGSGATIRITFDDARRGSYELDVTADEAMQIAEGGRKVSRRGRKPASAQPVGS